MKKCSNLECDTKTNNPKYCSRSCAASSNNRKNRKRMTSSRLCSGCGSLTGSSAKYYCSDACRQIKDDKLIESREYARVRKTPENDSKIYQIWSSGDIRGIIWSDGSLSRTARELLLRFLGAKCSICGWDEVNPVSLRPTVTVDHIDGDALNNNLENLKILCPNHHSLTATYGALNMASMREKAGLAPLDRKYARFGRQKIK